MLDYNKLSYEDIRRGVFTHSSSSKGKGRDKVTKLITYVKTNIGVLEGNEWVEIAYQVIKSHGDLKLLEHMKDYVKTFPWINEQDIKRNAIGLNISKVEFQALDLCIEQIYNNPAWVCFIPFNKTYRLEFLKDYAFVNVIMDCCKEKGPGEVMREQIRDGFVCCPFCGRFSQFKED